MKKITIIIIILYIVIGMIFWGIGYAKAPELWQDILGFLLIVFLWPVVIGRKVLLG